MSGYPNAADIFQQRPDRHDEIIPMDSYTGSNYENSSMPRHEYRGNNQHYRKREGWEDGTRESTHHPNPPDGYTDDLGNQLPSRQKSMKLGGTVRGKSRKGHRKSFATMRLRHGEKLNIDETADTFIQTETDTVDAAQETMKEIRELPKSMSFKKAVRAKVEQNHNTKKKEHPPNCLVQFYYRMSMNWQKLKGKMAEVLYSMELWKASLKTIEGNFGTGVTSYFQFLKWLFLFNIPTFLIIFFFVVIPQLLWRIRGKNSAVYTANDASFTGVELLTGGDWFKQTELYYGSYTNYTVNVIGDTNYSMRFAYLLGCAGFYVITLLVLAYSLVKSYKVHFIEGSQSNRLYYVSKVLCGWDFMVMKEDTRDQHHKTLTTELKEYLAEFRKEKVHKTCLQWCGMILLRLVINIAVIAALAGLGYLVWYIAPLTQKATINSTFWKDIATPLVISAINLIVPFVFSYLASLENYHNPWVDIFLTMLRTITLNIVTLGALLGFWFISSDISCSKRNTTPSVSVNDNTTMSTMVEATTVENSTVTTSSDDECTVCWENFVGQQFYSLVIIDFVFIILGMLCSEFLKKILSRYTKISEPEFNIGRNTLNLIYSQSLVWLGVFYCPLLPFLMILKLFILFYIKKVSVVYNCRPSDKSWRGGRTYTIILLLLFIAFQLCFIALSYSIVFMSSSQDCGPFIGYETSYAVVSEAVDNWKEENKTGFVKGLVEILTSAAFYITIFMIVCAIAYYTRLVSKGRKDVVARLRKQIQMEGKDKNFLKKVADHVRKGVNVRGPRQRVTHTPSGEVKPRQNGGIARGRENNNGPTDRNQPVDPDQQYHHNYMSPNPADVVNPGYRENSPTTKPALPYFAGHLADM